MESHTGGMLSLEIVPIKNVSRSNRRTMELELLRTELRKMEAGLLCCIEKHSFHLGLSSCLFHS